jgi:ribosomal protein S18 acetylase RimI-like enzyme
MSAPGSAELVSIRRATVSDAATVSALNADVQAIHASALPWLFKAPSAETFPLAAAASMLARDDVLVYVAYLGDEPVGYAYAQVRRHPDTSLQYAFEEIHLHHLSVSPRHRGHGVGGVLLSAVRRAADDRGIRQVALDVWTFNQRAEGFFRRHGFEAYNERLWLRR